MIIRLTALLLPLLICIGVSSCSTPKKKKRSPPKQTNETKDNDDSDKINDDDEATSHEKSETFSKQTSPSPTGRQQPSSNAANPYPTKTEESVALGTTTYEWGQSYNLSPHSSPNDNSAFLKVSCNQTGQCITAWRQEETRSSTALPRRYLMTRQSEDGLNWHERIRVDRDSSLSVNEFNVTMGEGGVALATWTQLNTTGSFALYFAHYDPAKSKWTLPKLATPEPIHHFSTTFDPKAKNFWLIWSEGPLASINLKASKASITPGASNNFSTVVDIAGTTNERHLNPVVKFNGNGKGVLAWLQHNSDKSPGFQVNLSFSDGQLWSQPTIASTSDSHSDTPQVERDPLTSIEAPHDVAISPNNRVLVTWKVSHVTFSDGKFLPQEIWARSFVAPEKADAPVRLSDTANHSSYPIVAFDSSGYGLIAYRTSTPDNNHMIYTAAIDSETHLVSDRTSITGKTTGYSWFPAFAFLGDGTGVISFASHDGQSFSPMSAFYSPETKIWSALVDLTKTPYGLDASFPTVHITNNGGVASIWRQRVPFKDTNDSAQIIVAAPLNVR